MGSIRKAWNLFKLMRSQWKPYEELKKLQNRKLRAILKYAYQNIRFYHEKLEKAGVKPEEIKMVEDLTKIPYTTKSEVKANFPDKMVASNVDLNKCWKPQTAGSTGRPVTVVYNEEAEDFEKAAILRANLGCGQRLFDRWIVFTDPRHIIKKKWFQNFGLFNPLRFSLFMGISKQVDMLQSVSPEIIYAYSSHLYILAKFVKEKDVKINPRLLFSTAELLDQKTRNYIEEVFGSKLYDQFGCVEFGRTAWECPKRCGYHMDMEAVVMEFIRDDEQVTSGERGEIVYTGLYNYAMPLIRYKIEDIGVPTDEKCSCGRGLPLMKVVEGRKNDFLVSSDGSLVSPVTIGHFVKNISEIEQCRFIQERSDLIIVQIVEKMSLSEETITQLKKEIKAILGKSVDVRIQKLNELEKDKSGKLRKVISKVNLNGY